MYSEYDASEAIKRKVYEVWSASPFKDVALHGNNGPSAKLDEIQEVANWEIEFTKSEQVTIGSNPIDRTWGYVEFHFGVREGRGTTRLRQMKSHVKQQFKAKSIGGVKVLIPSAGRPEEAKGWLFESLYIPFYFDSATITAVP